MPQTEVITASDESELYVGGNILIISAGASCDVTMADLGDPASGKVKLGASYTVTTTSVAGGNHTLTLPDGVLFNGTAAANVATFDAAHEFLGFTIVSATLAVVWANPAGITFS
jgi:hypothetical protein